MPSTRVIADAALGCVFVSGLFNGQGMAQTASTDPVSKLIHYLHPGEQDTKQPGTAAKQSSKARHAAKKPASTRPISKESPPVGTTEVTVSEPMIDGEIMRSGSPNDAKNVYLAGNAQGTLESDAAPASATLVKAVVPEMMAPADKSNSTAAVGSQTPSISIGSLSWLLRVIAALGGAISTGLLAWFLIDPSASTDVWVRITES